MGQKRSFAAVLFRRIAGKTQSKENQPSELFLTLAPEVKRYIRDILLQCFAEETDRAARNKTGDAVAEVARQLTDAGMLLRFPGVRLPIRMNLHYPRGKGGFPLKRRWLIVLLF